MKKNKALAVVIVTALFLGLLTFTAAVGFGPTGTGSAKNINTGLDLAGGGRVDQRPQDQRVAYAAQGQNRLYRQQQGGEVSGTARHRGDPTDDTGCRRSRTGHSIPPQNGLDRQKAVGTTAKCTYTANYTVQGGPRQVIWGQEGGFGVCG